MFIRNILKASALLYTAVSAQTACNNSPSLCSRPYNNITYLGTHDAAFLRDESTSFNTAGNQFYNTTVQLSAGVRMLTAQVHQFSSSGTSEWHLCHGDCKFLDAGKLETWLREIKTWLDANPNEVVTILLVNSDSAAAEVLGPQFAASGIDKYAYTPTSNSSTTLPQTWPTLQTLITANTRLITFIASLPTPSKSYPYLLDEFTHVYENNYENTSPTNYSCTPHRPSGLTPETAKSSNRLFLMNHFLYSTQVFGIQSPNISYTPVTNSRKGEGSLGAAVENCTTVYNKPPNFVLVDFFNVGSAIESVDAANGVQTAVGRTAVDPAIVDEKKKKPSQSNDAAGGKMSFGAVALGFGVVVVGLLGL